MYKAQTRDMFLLKYFELKSQENAAEIPLIEVASDIRQLQNVTALEVYSFPKHANSYGSDLLSDLSHLERDGLIRAGRHSELRYTLSALGEYFCTLLEMPKSLVGYSFKTYVPKE